MPEVRGGSLLERQIADLDLPSHQRRTPQVEIKGLPALRGGDQTTGRLRKKFAETPKSKGDVEGGGGGTGPGPGTGPGAGPGGPGGNSVGDGATTLAHTPLKTPRISSSSGQVCSNSIFKQIQLSKDCGRIRM